MQTITLCTVVYHEEKVIERCLKSFHNVVDEIIVIHDGPCNDKTLEIASKYTSKIYIGPRRGDLAPHLQFCLKQASGDWIMCVGADEFLPDKLQQNMRKLVEDPNADAYAFLNENWCSGKLITRGIYGRFWRLLLYRKSRVIDERIRVNGCWRTQGQVVRVPYWSGHRPLQDNYTIAALKRKWIRLASLEAAEIIDMQKAVKPPFFYFALAPFAFFYHFLTLFKQDTISSGWSGWKITFYQSIYYFLLNVMIGYLLLTNPQKARDRYNIPPPDHKSTYSIYDPNSKVF